MTEIQGLTPTEHAVRGFFRKAPKDKPYSVSSISEEAGVDWHTAKEAAKKLVGKDVNGTLQRTTDDSHELFYRDPQVNGSWEGRNKIWVGIFVMGIATVLTSIIVRMISRARRRRLAQELRGLSDELMQKFGPTK